MVFLGFTGRVRPVRQRLFCSTIVGLFLLLLIHHVILVKRDVIKSDPIRIFSDDEEQALVKLDLLRDDDPLLSTIPGSNCTLGFKDSLPTKSINRC